MRIRRRNNFRYLLNAASIWLLALIAYSMPIKSVCAETNSNIPPTEQKENVSYLSPEGDYTQIRLVPRSVPVDTNLSYPSCAPFRSGEMFINEADNLVYICEPQTLYGSSILSGEWKPFNTVWGRQQFTEKLIATDNLVNQSYDKTFLNLYPVNSFSNSDHLTIGHDEPGLKLSVVGRGIFLNTPEIPIDDIHNRSERHIDYDLQSGGSINEHRKFSNSLDTSISLKTSGPGRKFIWMPERDAFVAGRVGPAGAVQEDYFDNDHMPHFSIRMGRNPKNFTDLAEGPFTSAYAYNFILGGADNVGRFIVGGQNNSGSGCYVTYLFGGEDNHASACSSFIIGGKGNTASSQDNPFVLGGQDNISCQGTGILGGFTNKTYKTSAYSFIANGQNNTVGYADDLTDNPDQFPDDSYVNNEGTSYSAIFNGNDNRILSAESLGDPGKTEYALIATGNNNVIGPGSDYSAIVNGYHNQVLSIMAGSPTGKYNLVLNGGDKNGDNYGNIITIASSSDTPRPSSILNGRDNWLIEFSDDGSNSNTIINTDTAVLLSGGSYNTNSYTTIGTGRSSIQGSSYTWIPSTTNLQPSSSNQFFGFGTLSGPTMPLVRNSVFYAPKMWINTTKSITCPLDPIDINNQMLVVLNEPNGDKATIITSTGEIAFYTHNGTSWVQDGIFNGSDRRLKKNIHPVSGALETLKKLRGVSFEWKEDIKTLHRPGRHLGFIAQEMREIFPQWIYEESDGFLKVRAQQQPAALIVSAIQEVNNTFHERQKIQSDKIEKMTRTLKTLLTKQAAEIKTLNKTIEQNTQLIKNLSGNKEVQP